jgi:hypothetical protein
MNHVDTIYITCWQKWVGMKQWILIFQPIINNCFRNTIPAAMLQFRQWSVYEGDLHSSCWLSPLLTWLMVQEFCALHFLCFFAQTKHISRSVTSLSSKNDVTVTPFQSYQECVLTWPLQWWWSKDSHCMCNCNPYGKAQQALSVPQKLTLFCLLWVLSIHKAYSSSTRSEAQGMLITTINWLRLCHHHLALSHPHL